MPGESFTQMIFFITAVTVASMLVFALNSNFQSFMKSLNFKAKSVSSQVATSIKIINDPCYLNDTVHVKNIGSPIQDPNTTTIIINGEIKMPSNVTIQIGSNWIQVNSSTIWEKGQIVAFKMPNTLPKNNQLNRIKVVTENGIFDEIVYTNVSC
ncbi:MAG: hypothetical protein N3E37_01300 [Candidatus Micrarchaeota archaeon]|nr:hypothetical protein [Candidatus Micrarchaeota archaeon]